MSRQIVNPNTSVTDGAGWCLRFTQTVWGAPARYESAWKAWEATTLKHSTSENIPNDISVVVWFSHYGTYGENGNEYYGNWGHVVSWIAGRGYLSSPTNGVGQKWLSSIQEVERAYSSKYVGWSEDINGLRVAEITSNPTNSKGDNQMLMIHKPSGDANVNRFAVFSGNFWLEFVGQETANAFSRQIGAPSTLVSNDFWNICKASAQAGLK